MTLPQTQLQNQVNQQLQSQVNQMANSSSFFNKVMLHQQYLYPNNIPILPSNHQWNFPLDGFFIYPNKDIAVFIYSNKDIAVFIYPNKDIAVFIYSNKRIVKFSH